MMLHVVIAVDPSRQLCWASSVGTVNRMNDELMKHLNDQNLIGTAS